MFGRMMLGRGVWKSGEGKVREGYSVLGYRFLGSEKISKGHSNIKTHQSNFIRNSIIILLKDKKSHIPQLLPFKKTKIFSQRLADCKRTDCMHAKP